MSMSVTGAPERRVRHRAQDALFLMAFSAAVSVGLAGFLLLITILGGVVGR
jgi:uncharacterized iron-regulated membrane protein